MDHDDGFAVRAADEAKLDRQAFRARSGNVGAALQDGFCFEERVDEEASLDPGQTMQTVAHGGYDAEVSAAAAHCPEQFLFIVAAGDNDSPVSEHDLCGEQI